jgi:hypothetical protein
MKCKTTVGALRPKERRINVISHANLDHPCPELTKRAWKRSWQYMPQSSARAQDYPQGQVRRAHETQRFLYNKTEADI